MGKDTQSSVATQDTDKKYMLRALQLARKGHLTVSPNPMVGAVVVARGRIIGEGYHIRPGEGHAEVNAINSLKADDLCLLSESTIYVTLEPCAHYGRTPPCAELIIKSGIKRCVVGCEDPFAQVHGRGIQMLREAGVEVCVGVLEEDCRWLNRKFITFQQKHRPYITLKWARSSDGFIDRVRTNGAASRLSSTATQMHVHRQRAEHEAILVGHTTWRLDHPRLDLRRWFGKAPLRIVLGHTQDKEMPGDVHCFDTIDAMLSALYQCDVQSLLVEGGRQTLQSFIDRGLWDEAWEECATKSLGSGIQAPKMFCEPSETKIIWSTRFNHWIAPRKS